MAVGRAVAGGLADLGLCVCGTGNGVAMAANKVPGIRAAVVHDVTTAALARRHNHANVVCLGARTTGATVAVEALAAFLAAPEEGGRHDIRIDKLAGFDRRARPSHPCPSHRCRRDPMRSNESPLAADPEVASLIGQELNRQQTTLQLIASENFASPAVLAASGSVLTNKYSEGYPGRRYYGGNQIIDEVEDLARRVRPRCSGPTTPTCSRTRAPTPTWPPTTRCSNRARRSSPCGSTTGATSRTGRPRPSSRSSGTSCTTA